MPNRLCGPGDITAEEFPNAKEALGFHLNELTYKETINIMKGIGFNKFQSLYKTILSQKNPKPVILPSYFSVLSEIIYSILPNSFRYDILKTLVSIRLIAYKPTK